MDIARYQEEIELHASGPDAAHDLVPMLGLGAHVGAVLHSHQRYLTQSLIAESSRALLARELGLVLRWSAILANRNHLSMSAIAFTNLRKVDARARARGNCGIKNIPPTGDYLTWDAYQKYAGYTDQDIKDGFDPLNLSIPMLGLAGEVGNLLVEMKKQYRGDSNIGDWLGLINEELGDLLWYIAAVARQKGISLEAIAVADLEQFIRSTGTQSSSPLPSAASFDGSFPPTERFPRRLQLHFKEQTFSSQVTVTVKLCDASPNAFPDGPIPRGAGKHQGYRVEHTLGDAVTDNSRRSDAYRYHDAIHLGFLAVLGWSPNLRALLSVKRKSNQMIDETEDGARAVFAEEGLAAILAKQAPLYGNFADPALVPEATLDLISTVVEDLEVARLPYWMWRRAVSQGFTVMHHLEVQRGGFVLADLDELSLQYSMLPFPAGR